MKEGVVPQTLWKWAEAGSTRHSKSELNEIMPSVRLPAMDDDEASADAENFVTPKPVKLIDRVLKIATKPDAIVLDSFAGSGTTAHAVLAANKRDGGERRFILVEMEDYADSLTAERVRRVVQGYPVKGTQREELMRERLTWTKLRNADKLTHAVDGLENLHGHRFDRIKAEVRGGELIVTGETVVEERTEGLGGTFTFCALGEPVDMDAILTGEALPSFEALGALLFHAATNRAFDAGAMQAEDGYLGQANGRHVWLIYEPDLDYLKSNDAALTLSRARAFAATDPEADHLVFAPTRFASQKTLRDEGLRVEFAPLPFALYRMVRGEA